MWQRPEGGDVDDDRAGCSAVQGRRPTLRHAHGLRLSERSDPRRGRHPDPACRRQPGHGDAGLPDDSAGDARRDDPPRQGGGPWVAAGPAGGRHAVHVVSRVGRAGDRERGAFRAGRRDARGEAGGRRPRCRDHEAADRDGHPGDGAPRIDTAVRAPDGRLQGPGKTEAQAERILADAKALEEAGAFSLVLEGVPSTLAGRVTSSVHIPTIGIGAGPQTDGQVLVFHDFLGLTTGKAPKFVKRYANLADDITRAAQQFSDEVRKGTFPDPEHEYSANGVKPSAREVKYGAGA